MSNRTLISIVDDDEPYRDSMRKLVTLLGYTVEVFASAADFLRSHHLLDTACLVADVHMPGMNGLELQRALLARGIDRAIVFVTGQGDIPTTVQAMKAGAVTFLSKPVQRAELVAAVREALLRDAVGRAQHREREDLVRRLASLTPRERQVLELVATGMLNKQIAAELGAAEKTIKVHRGRIMEKMQVRTATALVGLLSRAETRAHPARGSPAA